MTTRKATKQLQYIVYGGGVSQPWKRYGEYSDTKRDTVALKEDRKILLAGNTCQTRLVFVGDVNWIN